ncbi:hypothetical protein JCM10212_001949 [Sporobolomyces blumeae]
MPPKKVHGNAPPLNAKNVASSFAKADSQSWFSRRSTADEWDAAREAKRRRLMASEEEISQAQAQGGDDLVEPKPTVNVLKSAPEGKVRPAKPADTTASTDPLARTIVIHPGSRWLRIGRASEPAPLAIPNVIARKSRSFAPDPSTTSGKGKEPELAARPEAPVPNGDSAVPVASSAPATDANGAPSSSANALKLQDTGAPPSVAGANGDTAMSEDASAANDNDYDSDTSSTPNPNGRAATSNPLDPLSAKISSLKADLRARMRAYKLRGQGNGNSQAATYNGTVKPESMGDEFEGDHEWTTGEQEVWVGNKAVRLPDPLASGYVVRHPFQRGGFNTVGYVSQQEFLGDVETLYETVLREELGIEREELKDYSVIFLIPDLYDEVYVREMSNLLLRSLGFKQLCVMQESVCSTFGAGISSACVIDIGASLTKITCVEEGLVLPETRMVLDFGGDDITSFMHTLLLRNGFPYREADLTKWYDWIVLEDIKERSVVLSEGDIGLNLYDFYIRHPGQATQKYTMRMYDDCILAPYALFAPRVIDFEKKTMQGPELWSKDVDDNIEIGQGGVTIAMKNSTRHLFLPTTSVPLNAPSSLAPHPSTQAPSLAGEASQTGSPAPPSLSGTPQPQHDPSAALGSSALPPLPGLTPTGGMTPSLACSPAPEKASVPLPPTGAAATSAPTLASIDTRYESSKIPLDVAVVESILAAGAEERMKKVAANLLIVGGTGGIHNVGFAVESRVSPQLVARIPSLSGHVSYVPAPREIEPENLAWKGISVLTKLDAANELWIRQEEWEMLGMRALRDRAFYWAG